MSRVPLKRPHAISWCHCAPKCPCPTESAMTLRHARLSAHKTRTASIGNHCAWANAPPAFTPPFGCLNCHLMAVSHAQCTTTNLQASGHFSCMRMRAPMGGNKWTERPGWRVGVLGRTSLRGCERYASATAAPFLCLAVLRGLESG